MAVCGIMILGAVMVPFDQMTEMRMDEEMQTLSKNISEMVDRFNTSDSESFTLSVDSILPESTELRFDGHQLILENNGRTYRSVMSVSIDKEVFGKGDIIVFQKTSEGISVRNIYDR